MDRLFRFAAAVWRHFAHWHDRWTRFDPERDGIPGPRKAEPRKAEPKKKAEKPHGKVHNIAGRRFLETCESGQIEWVNMEARIESGRSDSLTDADRRELEKEGLDEEKAAFLKPFWADELTNSQIVKATNGEGERYGLGARTVKKYTSAFSRAAGIEDKED